MTIWITIIGMGLVTYGTRFLPLVAFRAEALPGWFRRGLNYVPVAVLSAIIAPALLPEAGWLHYTVDGRLIAGLAAIITARLTGSVALTILAGMGIFLLLV